MNYLRIYDEFIADRRTKEHLLTEGFETHHVEPECMGGSDEPENLIKLTYADHLFAHVMLAWHYDTFELWLAVNLMVYDKKSRGRKARAWYSAMKSAVSRTRRAIWEAIPVEERTALMVHVYTAGKAAQAAMTPEQRVVWEAKISEKLTAHFNRMTPQQRIDYMAPALAKGSYMAGGKANGARLLALPKEEREVQLASFRAGNKAYFDAMTPEQRKAVVRPAIDARLAKQAARRAEKAATPRDQLFSA